MDLGLKVILTEHTIFDDLLNAEHLVTLTVNSEINIVTTRLKSSQVITQPLALYIVKLDVRDKDSTRTELKLVGNVFIAQDAAVSIPTDNTPLASVQRCLEDVKAQVLEQDAVTVIKDDNIAEIFKVVEFLIQANRAHSTLDNLILRRSASDSLE